MWMAETVSSVRILTLVEVCVQAHTPGWCVPVIMSAAMWHILGLQCHDDMSLSIVAAVMWHILGLQCHDDMSLSVVAAVMWHIL